MSRSFGPDASESNKVAVFIDFENIKRSVDALFVNERVDLKRILDGITNLAQGRVLIKRAYADWGSFRDYRSDLLENATQPVQAFALTHKGKNGVDIRMAIDVTECVLLQPEITHVALVSGDSDFTPLVMKLRELGRYVIGVGVRANTSNYLAKSCDQFLYYEELCESHAMEPSQLLRDALLSLGNRPVTGSALKIQMRKLDAHFDEVRLGYGSFLDFLRAYKGIIDIHRPPVGDVTVTLVHDTEDSEPVAAEADRYRFWLRENNFHYVPPAERQKIMEVLYEIFADARRTGPISLKEAKDRLHAWFEENQPAIPWEAINSTVYHLFYTWCFAFEKSEDNESRQLWDRHTTFQPDIQSPDALAERVERGVVRRLWERDRGELDIESLNQWFYDGNPEYLPRIKGVVETVVSNNFSRPGLS